MEKICQVTIDSPVYIPYADKQLVDQIVNYLVKLVAWPLFQFSRAGSRVIPASGSTVSCL